MTVHWISTTEAGRILGVHQDTARRWCIEGRIPSVHCGRLWLVRADLLGGAR